MRFTSTRGEAPPVSFSQAMTAGLAPDGGLYLPESLPAIDWDPLPPSASVREVGEALLHPFLAEDPLAPVLPEILLDALDFPIRLRESNGFHVLELFHGPTAAFKDVGARFMAAAYERLVAMGGSQADPQLALRTVLVATSGDTGGAVGSAFVGRAGFRVVILYPAGGVSPRQEHQLTAFGGNVEAYAVGGTFDDCQRLVKGAFASTQDEVRLGLTTANSINVARLLPQVVYYAAASRWYREERGHAPRFVVPTGNLGNALAAVLATRLGAPIADVVMACNANRTLPEFSESGVWDPRASVRTHANAMDVGDPSNAERLFALYPSREACRRSLTAVSVSDREIEDVIRGDRETETWDPHTATAVHALRALQLDHAIAVATAHPAKFPEIVEPLVGRPVDIPAPLARILSREPLRREMAVSPDALEEILLGS